MSPLDKKLHEKDRKKQLAKRNPDWHVTAVRVPKDTWKTLRALSKKTGLTANAIMNVGINDVIAKEKHRLDNAA